MRETKKIDSVLEDARSLQDLSQTFTKLDELNKILHLVLPENLVEYCHIGAIDIEKNLIILYLDNSALRHLIISMANLILETFSFHHYSFTGLITRIRPQVPTNPVRRKTLKPEVKDKLTKLAHSINRPDLIKNEVINEEIKEIEF